MKEKINIEFIWHNRLFVGQNNCLKFYTFYIYNVSFIVLHFVILIVFKYSQNL